MDDGKIEKPGSEPKKSNIKDRLTGELNVETDLPGPENQDN